MPSTSESTIISSKAHQRLGICFERDIELRLSLWLERLLSVSCFLWTNRRKMGMRKMMRKLGERLLIALMNERGMSMGRGISHLDSFESIGSGSSRA